MAGFCLTVARLGARGGGGTSLYHKGSLRGEMQKHTIDPRLSEGQGNPHPKKKGMGEEGAWLTHLPFEKIIRSVELEGTIKPPSPL